MRDGDVAAGRDRVHERGHDRLRAVGVGDRVQDGKQRDRYRPGEVQQLRGLGQDRESVTQVRVNVLGGAFLVAGEQRAGVGEHDRIVVHVHHPGLRRDRLGDLVGVARRGNTGADVKELPDPRLAGEVADGAPEERPVGAGGVGRLRVDLEHFLRRRPVGGVVVLTAEQEVVHPRLVCHGGVQRHPARLPGRAAASRHCCVTAHYPAPLMSRWRSTQ